MNNRKAHFVGVSLLTLFGAGVAGAAPVQNPVTGHYYEAISAPGISWEDARDAVAQLPPFMGVQGHLATLTSAGEDNFVEFNVRQPAGLSPAEAWIGGVQPGVTTSPGEGWIWVNGEGAISTPTVQLPSYSNWLPGEPNDSGIGESHLAIGLLGQNGWNDEGALSLIGGYIVEYDVPRQAADCSVSAGGCETIEGHELTFPEGSIPPGANITFNAFEFDDDPARCGVSPLVIFGPDTDPDDTKPELIIPPYLCGSPKFVVIAVDSSELNILDGTVLVENKTDLVLPNNLYVCEDPIFQDFPSAGDPQDQDVVVWQTTDPTGMLESDPGVGGTGQFAGAAGEFTNECGSSRARVKGASYYVVGMHIDFGPGNDWAANTAGNFGKFVELTRYKLSLLEESVNAARADRALRFGTYRVLRFTVRAAIRLLDRERYRLSLLSVRSFLFLADLFNYQTVPNENYNGEHLMRGSNAEFMLRVKVIPYAP